MKCQKCGAENSPDAGLCKACGAALEVDSSDELTISIQRQEVPKDLIIKDRFRVIKKLGKGGMGEIFLAEDVKLKRQVAIKSILGEALPDATAKARFLREAQTASQLDHPNICTIFEIYEEHGNDYIVMQYVDGVTLEQITRSERLSIGKIADIAIQVCDGMIEANSRKIIHRDIKPANIMIDRKGVVRILDFGLAKSHEKSVAKRDGQVDSQLTERGIVMGTISYLSPEQARGQELDPRSDLFSFGIVLFELIEGQNPFQDAEQIHILYNVLNKQPEFSRHIPVELKKIVLKCLEKDRDKRYDDFSQLKNDLKIFRDHYIELKQHGPGFTEKIDVEEQELLLQEIQKATDQEDLGDIVYRIKKQKASTRSITRVQKNRLKYIFLPLLVIGVAVAALLYLTGHKGKGDGLTPPQEKFYIYLHPFDNRTGEKDLAEKIDYLLSESLNQFDPFKTINQESLGSSGQEKEAAVSLDFLKKRFQVAFELKGKITQDRGFYNIEARLISRDRSGEKTITSTGEGLDSFLWQQIDTISAGLYHRFFAQKGESLDLKKITGIYGSDWQSFSDLYQGHRYFKRLESDKAEQYLKKAGNAVMARFILSDVYTFNGERTKALAEIQAIIPSLDQVTTPLRLKVLARKARLEFNFQQEIHNLEQLLQAFPFSKEAFYELGEAYFHYRDPQKAAPYYEKALELDKNYSTAINHLAYCRSFTGDHGQAIVSFEDYKNLDQTANSFDSLGDGYFYCGDLVNAEAFKKRAVSLDEKSVPYSFVTLAEIYILKAEYEKAEAVLERYCEVLPTPRAGARANAIRAFIHLENRQSEKALEAVNLSLEKLDSDDINNHSAEAHWLKGIILLSLNRLEESKKERDWLQAFKEKYRLSQENFSEPYKYLVHLEASILEKGQQIDRADETFKSLIRMKDKLSFWTYYNYQFFHTEYARFLQRNGLPQVAQDEIDQCLRFNPDYIPALWTKIGILEQQKDDTRFSIYTKILGLYGQSSEKNYLRSLLLSK